MFNYIRITLLILLYSAHSSAEKFFINFKAGQKYEGRINNIVLKPNQTLTIYNSNGQAIDYSHENIIQLVKDFGEYNETSRSYSLTFEKKNIDLKFMLDNSIVVSSSEQIDSPPNAESTTDGP